MDTHRSRILEETGSKLVTCSVEGPAAETMSLVLPALLCRAPPFVSSLCSLTKARRGGADRDRTDDLKLAKLPLSQLSYGPVKGSASDQVVGPERVERSTSRLSGVRSNHLSYEPVRCASEGVSITQQTDTPLGIGFNGRKGNEGGDKLAVCLMSFEKLHECS